MINTYDFQVGRPEMFSQLAVKNLLFHHYKCPHRAKYVKRLLQSSKKNVNEILDDSGFENAIHFSPVFKERFGLAPLQYRKQNLLMFLINQ